MGGSIAIIVAAGRGQRFGGDVPKQYRMLGGKPVLRHVVDAFQGHPAISAVRVVIHPDDNPLYDAAVPKGVILAPVAGGASRQESVLNGLESVADLAPDKVLIHDAARPFIDAQTIARALEALDRHPAALVGVPVVDTIKRAGQNDTVDATVARDGLWRAQTPQGFRYKEILEAHRAARGLALTDDAAVAERAGLSIALVQGDEANFKITTEADLARAEKMLGQNLHTRAATGFDVHAFGPGDHVWLCGIQVPHDQGLVGHSDADVALHALTDALLGCIGAGDIGSHFSDQDSRWRGAASHIFLKHAADLVANKGGRIVHVDATIICERPKV
ncbi:MAG: 2-C-methyl-D-erythritol 4-phosphate cytidylyltransferase, partial [Alphaproteobacteria bacterium]